MKFEEFELERNQSLFEHEVDYNLSESGLHPLRLKHRAVKSWSVFMVFCTTPQPLLKDNKKTVFLANTVHTHTSTQPAHI